VEEISAALRASYNCHTAILYGSHAKGDARPGSDYDVAGFADVSTVERVTGAWRNSYLDVFIYPESRLTAPTSEMVHLRGGVVLFQEDAQGERLLSELDQIYAAGPEPLGDSELRARRHWAWKMSDRAAHDDAEGNFRRAWLLMALLEDYFHLRHRWYEGPKKSLSYLAENEPQVYAAFEAALRPGASLTTIAKLVETVAGPRVGEVQLGR
jgi:hypothetical protein